MVLINTEDSALDPLFFILYTANILNDLKIFFSFADDRTLYDEVAFPSDFINVANLVSRDLVTYNNGFQCGYNT